MRKTLALLATLLATGAASAQTLGSGVSAISTAVKFTQADGTTAKSVFTAAGNGAKITAIYCDDPNGGPPMMIASTVRGGVSSFYFQAQFSGNTRGQNTNNLLAAGVYSTPKPLPDLPVDENGVPYLLVQAGDTLAFAMSSALDSSTTVTCRAIGQQY